MWYYMVVQLTLGVGSLRKGGMPMDTFQTIMAFTAFGSFLLALLSFTDKRK